jgi:hypothetical protein
MIQKEYSFFQWKEMSGTEEKRREHLFRMRWPEGFACPKCGCPEYYSIKRGSKLQCKSRGRQASVAAGTVMDKTRIPLANGFGQRIFCGGQAGLVGGPAFPRARDVSPRRLLPAPEAQDGYDGARLAP